VRASPPCPTCPSTRTRRRFHGAHRSASLLVEQPYDAPKNSDTRVFVVATRRQARAHAAATKIDTTPRQLLHADDHGRTERWVRRARLAPTGGLAAIKLHILQWHAFVSRISPPCPTLRPQLSTPSTGSASSASPSRTASRHRSSSSPLARASSSSLTSTVSFYLTICLPCSATRPFCWRSCGCGQGQGDARAAADSYATGTVLLGRVVAGALPVRGGAHEHVASVPSHLPGELGNEMRVHSCVVLCSG
jgi:hypothetical protein